MGRHQVKYIPIKGRNCPLPVCTGTLVPRFSETLLHTELEHLDFLFNVENAVADKVKRCPSSREQRELEQLLPMKISKPHREALTKLHQTCQSILDTSAYQF